MDPIINKALKSQTQTELKKLMALGNDLLNELPKTKGKKTRKLTLLKAVRLELIGVLCLNQDMRELIKIIEMEIKKTGAHIEEFPACDNCFINATKYLFNDPAPFKMPEIPEENKKVPTWRRTGRHG